MNAKFRPKVINVAFKQLQRLPDWPLVKIGKLECAAEEKVQPILQTQPLKVASPSKALVE